MKKMFFAMLFCVSMTISFDSCGNKAEGNCEVNDSTVVDTVLTDSIDSVMVDSICLD